MHVISFVTQKGGSGKSTTAASVAVAAFEQGRRVFVLELDRQGTLSDWNESREAETGPEFERIDATALDKAISTLKDAAYDLVVIDTPGIDSPAANAAMRVADLCLIPCRPTATDLKGCLPTVRSLIRLEKTFAFVLTQCPSRSPRVDETRAGLVALGLIADPPIVSRTDHQDGMAAGMGVTEYNSDGAAAAEIRQLWTWIENKLEPKGKRNAKAA
ncbi:MAG: AAA family ATPase [Roseiarcus sp.]|jgi:chromosome partitioning protein